MKVVGSTWSIAVFTTFSILPLSMLLEHFSLVRVALRLAHLTEVAPTRLWPGLADDLAICHRRKGWVGGCIPVAKIVIVTLARMGMGSGRHPGSPFVLWD